MCVLLRQVACTTKLCWMCYYIVYVTLLLALVYCDFHKNLGEVAGALNLGLEIYTFKSESPSISVSYTHLTLPTNREV